MKKKKPVKQTERDIRVLKQDIKLIEGEKYGKNK